jgi:hypothetical protein
MLIERAEDLDHRGIRRVVCPSIRAAVDAVREVAT